MQGLLSEGAARLWMGYLGTSHHSRHRMCNRDTQSYSSASMDMLDTLQL